MGRDQSALQRLWREKRGEAEPEEHSGNLLVQLGLATETEKTVGITRYCKGHRRITKKVEPAATID
jgi:hypothetical protein